MDAHVENALVNKLDRECEGARVMQQRLRQEAQGWFSVDQEKYRAARAVDDSACVRLRGLNLGGQNWLF